jgi:hypothetical protein
VKVRKTSAGGSKAPEVFIQAIDMNPEYRPSTIKYAIKKQNQHNDQIFLPRCSHSRASTSEQQDCLLQPAIESFHIKMRKLQIAVNNSPTKNTVRRLFQSLNMRKWKQWKRPGITEKNASKHLQWVQSYAHYTPVDWNQVK